MSDVTLAELAAALIAPLEGVRYAAYTDSGSVWTIGIGHTKGVKMGDTATEAQVQQWFAEDQAPLIAMVKDRPILEAAALVSFGFNCGLGALQRVMAGHSMLTDFVKDAHGNTLHGLVARRHLEETLIAVSQGLGSAPHSAS